MNYNNYFPASYQPVYAAPTVPQNNTQNNNSIIWVQGESAARAFAVAPGQSVMLMDSDASVFYIKSADASGMPMPLRIFDYTERTQQPHTEPQAAQTTEYVTRDEFEKRLSEILETRKSRRDKSEQS